MSFPHTTPAATSNELLLVYCGGTFGMKPSEEGLVVTPNVEETLTDLLEQHPKFPHALTHRIVTLQPAIDSADLDAHDALHVVGTIREQAQQAIGVVVIHGTDTLTFSSAVAAFGLIDFDIPVIFTGSQRSVFEPRSDAAGNFHDAVAEALTGEAGVRIVFGGQVLPGTTAVKTSTTAFSGFTSFRRSNNNSLHALGEALPLSRLNVFAQAPDRPLAPEVGTVKVFPGLKPQLLEAAGHLYPDGIVLETYGAGTAPVTAPGMKKAIRAITEAGTPVVATTQCQTGSITLHRYAVGKALAKEGVWSGHDLTTDAALAKLLVLSALKLTPEQVQNCFAQLERGAIDASSTNDDIVEECLA